MLYQLVTKFFGVEIIFQGRDRRSDLMKLWNTSFVRSKGRGYFCLGRSESGERIKHLLSRYRLACLGFFAYITLVLERELENIRIK